MTAIFLWYDSEAEDAAEFYAATFPESHVVWRKIHLGIDEQTLEVRALEITGSHFGEAPVPPDLLSEISAEEEIASVTADGAHDTRKCHDAIAHPIR